MRLLLSWQHLIQSVVPSSLEHFLCSASRRSDLVFPLSHRSLLTPLLTLPLSLVCKCWRVQGSDLSPFSSPSTLFIFCGHPFSPIALHTSYVQMTLTFISLCLSSPVSPMPSWQGASSTPSLPILQVSQASHVQSRALPSYLFPSLTWKTCSPRSLLHISKYQHHHPVAQSEHLGIFLVFFSSFLSHIFFNSM